MAVLDILSKCESLPNQERFARRHHPVLTELLGIDLKRLPSDSAFRYFFLPIEPISGVGSAFIAPVTLYSAALGVAIA